MKDLDLYAVTISSLFSLMERSVPDGVELINGGIRRINHKQDGAGIEVHVHHGIKILAEFMGKELFNPVDLLGDVKEDYLAFISNGVMYFQLADHKKGEFVWL